MPRKTIKCALCLLVLVSTLHQSLAGQEPTPPSTVVPQLVSYSGKLIDAGGKPIVGLEGVTFAIYKDQSDSSPLWVETQNVTADAKGNYMVQLGASSSQGIPLDLFASGEARWLGVRVNNGGEQTRVLLLSVPYALKAADAQTIGGLPASAFVLAAPGASDAGSANLSNSKSGTSHDAGGSGTQNYIAIWTDSVGDLGNSVLYQLGTGPSAKIGINVTNPLLTLDVNGGELVRGLFEMATTGFATPTKAYNSQPLNIESSAFNSSTKKYTLNHFQWQAEATGNNTSTPGATLNLLYGTDPASPTETGLSLNSQGIFTFAPGQTFPGGGGGTVTSVGLSAPSSDFTVTGSPITASGTLGLNWTVPPTNADVASAIVRRDANGAFSAGEITGTATDDHPAISATSTNVFGTGVFGSAPSGSSSAGTGVVGQGWIGVSGTGSNVGVSGTSTVSTGVTGSGPVTGVAGGGGNYGVTGNATGNGSTAIGVYGSSSSSTTGIGVYGDAPVTGVYGNGNAQGTGVYGVSLNGTGVFGTSGGAFGSFAVVGLAPGPMEPCLNCSAGVYGQGQFSGGLFFGADQTSTQGFPADGLNAFGGNGVLGGQGGDGVFIAGGTSSGGMAGDGITAFSGVWPNHQANVYAGNFNGDVTIEGNLSKSGGSFKIDHPLDPANKYLYHSFVESPDMKNIYDGNITTDSSGLATVTLPEWFETLNRDFRYQLTVIGQFAQAIVAKKVENNEFEIKTSLPNVEVSWQITGIRQDAWANAHRIPVEENKDAHQRGYYLHPDLYGQPPEKSVAWVRNSDSMKRMHLWRNASNADAESHAANH